MSASRSEEHTSELQSRFDLVCRLLLEKKNVIRVGGFHEFRHVATVQPTDSRTRICDGSTRRTSVSPAKKVVTRILAMGVFATTKCGPNFRSATQRSRENALVAASQRTCANRSDST